MDLQKAKIILEKISALHKSISMDEDHIAAIERDLMLNYLRQLYECYSTDQPAKASSSSTAHTNRTRVKTTPSFSPRVKVEPTPEPVTRVKPAPDPVEVSHKPEPVVVNTTPKSMSPPPVKEKETPSKTFVPTQEEADPDYGDYDVLFEHRQAKELSEKLSELPIQDLTKAMGINERILTINELFNGDSKVYEQTMSALNGLRNFDEAKTFLHNHVARKYNWIDKSKKLKAKEFIKLIRRRYK